MFDVLGIGENSVDHVYRLPVFPQPGASSSKVRIQGYMRRPGGQVATSMAACARLRLRSGYVGVFGDDANGHIVRQALQEHGVDVRHAIVRHGTSRYAVILVDEQSGDRVVLWDRGSDVMLQHGDITPSLVSQARLLHVDAVDEEVSTHAARLARAEGVPVTCDIDRVTARTRD